MRGPLLNDDAQIVELLESRLDIAQGARTVLRIEMLRLGNGDHAAIAPGARRNRRNAPGQIFGPDLRLLMMHGEFARDRRSLGRHAQRQRVRTGQQQRIGPGTGIVNIGIEAFGGQRNPVKLGTLLIALTGRGLRLALGLDGGLRHTDHRLLFLTAGNEAAGHQQARAQQLSNASLIIHKEKNIRNRPRSRRLCRSCSTLRQDKRTMSARIVAIVGSYRKGSATDAAVEAVLAGARTQGAITQTIQLADEQLGFCTNCRGCTQIPGEHRGRCTQNDGLESILGTIEAADALVLASPVNYWNVTALFRRFMERLLGYTYWPWGQKAPHMRTREKPRRAVLIACAAMPGFLIPLATGAPRALKTTAQMLGAKAVGSLWIGQVAAHPQPALNPRVAQRARRLGARLV